LRELQGVNAELLAENQSLKEKIEGLNVKIRNYRKLVVTDKDRSPKPSR
jgi:hypothetical protein